MGFLILSTILFCLGFYIIYWIHSRGHLDIVVKPVSPPDSSPLISICIPARNEQRNIQACVRAALAQSYPAFEVIVTDDRSTDSTAAILHRIARHDPKLKVVSGSQLPEGWAGKPHALHQAVSVASGEWLCFMDADTFLESEALSACYTKALSTGADLFTILTRQIMNSFWEKVLMPLVMTALSVGFTPRRVNDPRCRDAIANGQFILIKRDVYQAVGGHERIKERIVEDKALAERVKWSGYRLIIADGKNVARTRMYTSLPALWEGWTKNMYLGLRDQKSMLLLGAFGVSLAAITALFLPIWPILGLWWLNHGGGWLAVAVILKAVSLWSALLLARNLTARAMGISGWYALTTPLGAGIFAAMMVASAWKVLSGRGVTWKGRIYSS